MTCRYLDDRLTLARIGTPVLRDPEATAVVGLVAGEEEA
jgi:hypothetical protein